MQKALFVFLLTALFFLAAPVHAQQGNTTTIIFAGVPTGTCGSLTYAINNANGDLYDCFVGSWNKVSGGGGGASNCPGAGGTVNAFLVDSGTQGTCTDSTVLAGGTAGTVVFPGSSSGTVTVGAAATAGTVTSTLPASSGVLGVTIASGTSTMGTAGIGTGACASTVTTTATGVATTDVIVYTPSVDPQGVTGYGVSATGSLYIWAYPTSGDVNFEVCNNTAGTITPSALTLNWRVAR